ncbi:MAG: DUF2190 family protein [Lachnospiraceae bacterium]|nr:DUF2190 family protein [Lachnospiraceae bacterium]
MATYEYSGINSSATISLLAGAALTNPKGIALALDEDGVKLPSAGADVVGIALLTNDDAIAVGGRVDVQIKDVGKVFAGGSFDQGDLLTVDATGKAVKATGGKTVFARALAPASASGDLVTVQIMHCGVVPSA